MLKLPWARGLVLWARMPLCYVYGVNCSQWPLGVCVLQLSVGELVEAVWVIVACLDLIICSEVVGLSRRVGGVDGWAFGG